MSALAPDPTSTESDQSKLSKLNADFKQAEMARQPFEGTWLLNLAFVEGNQWLCWDHQRLVQPKLGKNRILITDNRIQPAVRKEVAKMTKSRPAWDLTPDSDDDGAIDGAKFGEMVVESKWDSMACQPKLRRALEWSRTCSAGFWKVTWDRSLGKGREVVVGPDGKVARNPQTNAPVDPSMLQQLPPEVAQQLGAAQRVCQGDARIDVRSPFQVYPDPLADSMDECEKMFEKSVVSPVYLKGLYGVDLKPDSDASGGLVQAHLSRPGSRSNVAKVGVLVYELWEKGNAVKPQGRHVVWTASKILLDEANPYLDDEEKSILPYVMFPGITVSGRFWPTSIVEQLRPIQVELNKVKSQIAENRNRIGNPSLMVSRQAEVKYHGVPGERVEYNDTTQNAIPSYLSAPEMPQYVQNEIQTMVDAIQEISSQHEVSSGTVPAGVTAAAAINLLQEQDDTVLGPAIDDMETALSRAGQMLLRLLATYYTDERLVLLSGEDGKFKALKFKGAMLSGQIAGLRVSEGSTAPRSKAARQAAMGEMFSLMIQYGIRFDQRALRKFFVSYDVGGLESLLGDLDADERKVNRENRLMYAGIPVEVNSLVDNHEAEIAGHREEMKSDDFFKSDDATKGLFTEHLQAHIDAQAQLAVAAMPPPGIGGGAPPTSPESAPPGDLASQLSASAAGGGTLPSVSTTSGDSQ